MAQETGTYVFERTTVIGKEISSSLLSTSLDPCDYCLFGKQHRVYFSKISTIISNVLDLVYSDVCSPIEKESLDGNKFFVTFIDDASGKVWVYASKSKDQVFHVFQQFYVMVEKET